MPQPKIYIPSKEIENFCRRWKIKELSLVGSVLRDDFRLDSDVDVLVSSGSMSVRAGGAPEYILKIGHGWFDHMIGSVIQAPETDMTV
jgi:predicted nucleotidyltransferase